VVTQASGTMSEIVCGKPYEWAYDLSGCLQQWPSNLTLTFEEKKQLALGEVPLENINHSLWLNFNPLAHMNEHLRRYLKEQLTAIDLINHANQQRVEKVNANWKIVIDMYLSRQINNMQKAIDIHDKYTAVAPDIIEQSIHVNKKEGVRILLMPNIIMFVMEEGLYLMQVLPVRANETKIMILSAGLDGGSQRLLDTHLEKVMGLAAESQRCLTPYGYGELFVAEIEPTRTWWRAKLQEMLPVLRLSAAPALDA
jgi:hypothetical protein